MNVGFSIWAHPVRARWAEHLQSTLDAPVDIVYDKVAEPSREPAQRWAVCRRVLEHGAAAGLPYVGWIQDDALVARDFTAGVDAALAAAGGPIVYSPYFGAGRPDQKAAVRALARATAAGHTWLALRSLYWGVAVVIPTEHVETVLRIGSRSVFRYSPSDYRVGCVLRDRCGLQTWYTVPSLAEHRDVDSLVGHDKPGQERVAHRFIGQGVSALSVDYSAKPSEILEPRTDLARQRDAARRPVPSH